MHTMVIQKLLALTLLASVSNAFVPPGLHQRNALKVPSKMTIEFDPFTGRFEADEEDRKGGYGPLGSLLRQGPKPFLFRLVQPDRYEQSVLNFMSRAECSREEAQGNMDAFIENANDWVLQKLEEEKKGAAKFDYSKANMDPKQLALTAIWAAIVFGFIGHSMYSAVLYYQTVGFLYS